MGIPRSSLYSLNLCALLVNCLCTSSRQFILVESVGFQIGQAYSTLLLTELLSSGRRTDVFQLLKLHCIMLDTCLDLDVMALMCSLKVRFVDIRTPRSLMCSLKGMGSPLYTRYAGSVSSFRRFTLNLPAWNLSQLKFFLFSSAQL